MKKFLDTISSSKIMMKILMNYMEYFQEGSNFSLFLLLIKFIPLIIISHEWKFTLNGGLYPIVGKLTLTNYLKINTNEIFANLFVYILILLNFASLMFFYFSYSKLKNFDINVKKYKKFMYISLFILYFLNFASSQFYYEMLFYLLFKNWSKSQTNPSEYNSSQIFRYLSLPICIGSFCIIFLQNITFSIINFRPYHIKKTYYSGKINNINLNNITYPLLKLVIVLEFFIDFKTVLIIKIIVRIFLIFNFITTYYNIRQKINYSELFLDSFCFFSCIIEIAFIKDAFEISDVNAFMSNPHRYSLLYVEYFFYTKIALQIILAFVLCFFIKIYDNNFIINFFGNIKGKNFYCFYNKNYELIRKLKENRMEIFEFLSLLSRSINMHLQICLDSDCVCSNYKSLFAKDENFQSKNIEKYISLILEKNIKKNIKRSKYSSSENYCKYLILETLSALYFKKHYAKCFFNLEKIEQQNYYKNNFVLRVQVFLMKYEVIIDFLKFNKNSKLIIFRKMRQNYEKYNKYKDLESTFIKIFSDYKNLIALFYAKNIPFSEYYYYIQCLFTSINKGNKMIKYLISNHDQHNSLHIHKIDYITNFLNGENIFIPSHKISQFLTKNEDDKTEKMIVKHNKKKEFIIDYISAELAEDLGLKTNNIIGNDIHKFMSTQFIEFHYSHIVGHIKNNMLIIKNKEIYFVDKNGYAVNYEVDGSILITLSGEMLVFITVNPICNDYVTKNISFISCDEEGEIIALNKQFNENFYIDVIVKNIVQPNFFKNILTINKSKLVFKNDVAYLKYSYEKLIKNIRSIDYSKLWDYKTSSYFKYLENLNIDKYQMGEKVSLLISIIRRNLQEKFFFYDMKFYISINSDNSFSMIKTIKDLPINYNYNTEKTVSPLNPDYSNLRSLPENTEFPNLEGLDNNNEKLKNHFIKKKKQTLKKKKIKVSKTINKIKNLSFIFRKIGYKMIEKANNKLEKDAGNLKYFKKKMRELEYTKSDELKHKNTFIRMILFIIFILGFFIYLGSYSKSIYNQVEIFARMKINIYNLQQINYSIINSIFSMNLATGAIQPNEIPLKNLNFSTTLENSISYHLKILEQRRDNYQNLFFQFHGYYLNLDTYLMNNIAGLFDEQIIMKNLNDDWSFGNFSSKIFDIVEYNFRGISKILKSRMEDEVKYLFYEYSTKINFEDYDLKKYQKDKLNNTFNDNNKLLPPDSSSSYRNVPPSLGDKNIFYFLENSLFGTKETFEKLKNSYDTLIVDIISYYKTRLMIIFLIISSIVILFFIYEGISFYINYDKVFMKYFVLFDIIRNFLDELFLKIELLEELFMDFTDLNRRKYFKLADDTDFMEKKLSTAETLKDSYNEIKNKIIQISDRKTSNRKALIGVNIKTNRLLDYYENIFERERNRKKFEYNNGNNKGILKKTPNDLKEKLKFTFNAFNNQNTMLVSTGTNKIQNEKSYNDLYYNDNEKIDTLATQNKIKNLISNGSIINIDSPKCNNDANFLESHNNLVDNINKGLNNNIDFNNKNKNLIVNKNSNLISKFTSIKTNNNDLLFINTSLQFDLQNSNNSISGAKQNTQLLKDSEFNEPVNKENYKNAFEEMAARNVYDKNLLSTIKKPIETKTTTKENTSLLTLNKTDANLLNKDSDKNLINNLNNNKNLNITHSIDENIRNQISEEENLNIKKSKSFYIIFFLFWVMNFFILILIIINFDNTTKRFDKIKLFDSYAILFYKRILLFSEVLLIFQISVFKKNSNFLIENSKNFIDKIYTEYNDNQKQLIYLQTYMNPIIENLKSLEEKINTKDNFCKFLSENKYANYDLNDKADIVSKYFIECQNISQNFFSVGFSNSAANLYNYMIRENIDLINYFKNLKSSGGTFTKEKLNFYLNDFYFVFSFVNHDRIISDLNFVLDEQIKTFEDNLFTTLENFNTFIFYFLYVFIILLGLFSIYKTKFLIHDSDKLIEKITDIVENSIKFNRNNDLSK